MISTLLEYLRHFEGSPIVLWNEHGKRILLENYELKVIQKCLESFQNVDWALLREQKELLVGYLLKKRVSSELEGIINFLDTIQDNIVACGEKTELEVFGVQNESG